MAAEAAATFYRFRADSTAIVSSHVSAVPVPILLPILVLVVLVLVVLPSALLLSNAEDRLVTGENTRAPSPL
ncbi:hypothetical protein EYF80_015595 [Liparis tanakae]|uniref:Uncharacterized protein n=1 Tax=Liparis tanakae TaxID=230148 RepID=A0A4Z2I8F5_9TELE|nr:hypothetical protein EYF80_015595 [Liparis tanakae]